MFRHNSKEINRNENYYEEKHQEMDCLKDEALNTSILIGKLKKKILFKPSKHIENDTGPSKHFTPASQEWNNSIYSFNNNYVKSLPTADKNLDKLIKSYFNLNFKFMSKTLKAYKIKKQLDTRYARLSAKKIFVGKGDIKHTNSTVTVTFNVYNTDSFASVRSLKYIHKSLYYPNISLGGKITVDKEGKESITYNRPFTYSEYLALSNHYDEWYFSYILYFVNKLNLYYSNINTWYKTLNELREKNILNDTETYLSFNKIFTLYTFKYPNYTFYIEKCK